MIIVEQEKTYLVNFDNVCHITLAVDEKEKEFAVMAKTLDKKEAMMGIYTTEERAKEVLQEIVSKYKEYTTISNLSGNDIRGIYDVPKVYEMPKN